MQNVMTATHSQKSYPYQPPLSPYRHDPNSPARRAARLWVVGILAAFSFFWGLVFAFMAPALPVLWLAPVGIMALAVIWALPDTRAAPTQILARLFLAFVVILIDWPNYLSLNLHQFGMPWMSFQRLVSIPLTIIFLICISVSKPLRTRTGAALGAEPAIWPLLVAFILIQTYVMFLTPRFIGALDSYVNMQMSWTLMFFIACCLFSLPGWVEKWAIAVWGGAVLSGVVAVWEWRVHHVLWMGHVPSFLAIDPLVARELTPLYRAYTGMYRVQSTFGTSLGLGEFISLAVPFILHFAVSNYRWQIRAAASATVPFLIFVALITNARSALIGVLLGLALYGLYWGVMRSRRNPGSMFARSILYAYPVFAALGLASTFIFGRVHKAVWGAGEAASSTLGRAAQYHKGIPLVFARPEGYGISQAGITLGFYQPNGLLTIDTYYLAIALDYGILGFLVYYAMFGYGLFTGARHALKYVGPDRECAFLAPASISLAAFLVIKSVFAETGNHPFYFMVLGMVVALIYRMKSSTDLKPEPQTWWVTAGSQNLPRHRVI
jgi:hypothetical protein